MVFDIFYDVLNSEIFHLITFPAVLSSRLKLLYEILVCASRRGQVALCIRTDFLVYSTYRIIELEEPFCTYTKVQFSPPSMDKARHIDPIVYG